MQLFRLQSLQIYHSMKIPDWGPPIDDLNMDQIVTYVRPNTKMSAKWSDVPEDIKDTFERLGIPQAERKSLAGVGAQYDSELVYHNVKEEVAAQGVIYTDLESAMHGEYAEMIRTHFRIFTVHRAFQICVDHALGGNLFFYVVIDQLGIVLGSHACQRFPFGLWNPQPLKGILNVLRYIRPFGAHFRIGADVGHDLIHIQVINGRPQSGIFME